MKLLIAALGISLGTIAVLGIHLALSASPAASCQPVMVLAIGGCDSDGLCAVIIGNQQGQVKKHKLSYPVAGAVEELCE